MGRLRKGTSGEVFAAWFVQAAIWGVPAAVLSIIVVALLLIATEEPLLYRDVTIVFGLAGFAVEAVTLGGIFTLPFVMIGGVTAGVTAVIVTTVLRPGGRPRIYSVVIRLVVGAATTYVVAWSLFGVFFEYGQWSFADTATTQDWLVWFGPVIVIAFGAVWIAGRTAVSRSLPFLTPLGATETAP